MRQHGVNKERNPYQKFILLYIRRTRGKKVSSSFENFKIYFSSGIQQQKDARYTFKRPFKFYF